jgi:N-dimethylarginine dimethylaminohydrolase
MIFAPQVLMCPPDHYGIEYEINPWMDRRRPADHALAVKQWRDLRDLLERAGVTVSCLPPVAGLPDLVFTANAAMIHGDMAILARFRYPQRQGEEPHYERWLTEQGFHVQGLRSQAFFEGAGDALFCGDTLFAGYRIRSDVRAIHEIGALLGCRAIPLELVMPHYYHLDTCFCPLTHESAIYYPAAFDQYGRRALAEAIPHLIPVSEAEAWHFACNAVVVGQTVITNTGCPDLRRQLWIHGWAVWQTPLSEFVRAGGSAKCLTLRLDGEDAAAWKTLPAGAAAGDGSSRTGHTDETI